MSETIKGIVKYVSDKFNGGIRLEDRDGWINGTKNSKDQISLNLRGKQVEINIDDKGKLSSIKTIDETDGKNSIPPKNQSSNNTDAKIIRQSCLKAAATALSIREKDVVKEVSDEIMNLAKRMEYFVNTGETSLGGK